MEVPTPFKRAVGVDPKKYSNDIAAQEKKLPDSGFTPTSAELCAKIRNALWAREVQRVTAEKHLPLFPMIYENDECTGVPMDLFRCSAKKKKEKETGREIDNPNYGRFFVARKVIKKDEAGNTVFNERGYPVDELKDFMWFDETMFVRRGALRAVAPEMESVLLQYGSAAPDPLWTQETIQLIASLYHQQ